MTKLYSFRNEYPRELPFRIRMTNGFTRTNPETFTIEEIESAGFIEAPDKPTIQDNQMLVWNNGWLVVDIDIDDPSSLFPT
jgi:hypothetical protein